MASVFFTSTEQRRRLGLKAATVVAMQLTARGRGDDTRAGRATWFGFCEVAAAMVEAGSTTGLGWVQARIRRRR